MLITRFIRAPRQGTMAMLVRRMSPAARKEVEGKRFDAIGLVQTDLPSLFYFADTGQKAGDVIAAEIMGNCPQHISTIAFFGNTAAVSAALAAVQKAQSDK